MLVKQRFHQGLHHHRVLKAPHTSPTCCCCVTQIMSAHLARVRGKPYPKVLPNYSKNYRRKRKHYLYSALFLGEGHR